MSVTTGHLHVIRLAVSWAELAGSFFPRRKSSQRTLAHLLVAMERVVVPRQFCESTHAPHAINRHRLLLFPLHLTSRSIAIPPIKLDGVTSTQPISWLHHVRHPLIRMFPHILTRHRANPHQAHRSAEDPAPRHACGHERGCGP
jgi:hypothetical protein